MVNKLLCHHVCSLLQLILGHQPSKKWVLSSLSTRCTGLPGRMRPYDEQRPCQRSILDKSTKAHQNRTFSANSPHRCRPLGRQSVQASTSFANVLHVRLHHYALAVHAMVFEISILSCRCRLYRDVIAQSAPTREHSGRVDTDSPSAPAPLPCVPAREREARSL